MDADDEGGEEEHEEFEEELEEGDLEKQEDQNNPNDSKDDNSENGGNSNKIEDNAISPEAIVSQNLPTAIATNQGNEAQAQPNQQQ